MRLKRILPKKLHFQLRLITTVPRAHVASAPELYLWTVVAWPCVYTFSFLTQWMHVHGDLRDGSCPKGLSHPVKETYCSHNSAASVLSLCPEIEPATLSRGASRWLSGKETFCQYRRHRFGSRVGMIPWRRKWQPTPVFLPGESQGQRSLAGYSPRGLKQFETT